MDWSSVYENSGEERGNWEDYGETRSSRNAHRLLHRQPSSLSLLQQPQQAAASSAQYSPAVAYAFTVNYILGVGSLGVPYAFYRAGLVLGNVLIVLVTLVSYVTVMWVCESVARAQDARVLPSRCDETSPLKNDTRLSDADANSRNPIFSTSQKKCICVLETDAFFPEVTQLCDKVLGSFGSKLYQVSLLGLMYGGLVGYSQVFVNTFLTQVDHLGNWQLSSGHAVVVFACIVLPLSCTDLTEQIYVQLTMSVVRFAALLIMIGSATCAMYGDPYDGGVGQEDTAKELSPPFISTYSLVDWSGFGVMFSTGVFSQLFQHSVPGLLAPLGSKKQDKASVIFGSTLLTTMVFYIALGSVCSLYFGPKLATSVNLNWAEFTWGRNESMSLVPMWLKLLSMIVVVFPALDTLSVFPLISVTLGDNMAAVMPKRWTQRGRKSSWKLFCRFGAALPPLLISVFVSDLSVTLQISGLMGIYVAFFAPAMLQLYACRAGSHKNVYSGMFSGTACVVGVLVFGMLALLILLYQLVYQAA
uniref:Amino acid transporter transmembrane domain-containing protein n=1 Tax=Peronospora matthiolae TaxID=2874970 RepID=A0AAV1U1X6_9STRA